MKIAENSGGNSCLFRRDREALSKKIHTYDNLPFGSDYPRDDKLFSVFES